MYPLVMGADQTFLEPRSFWFVDLEVPPMKPKKMQWDIYTITWKQQNYSELHVINTYM
jgi:hypothetical protein